MTKQTMYQVDAFASHVFEGNPAAVCPLAEWLPDSLLQAIAEENNLAETAFFVPVEHGYELRWFTPVAEVDLCGHATLASAAVLYDKLGYSGPEIHFHTRSGKLVVRGPGSGAVFSMTFPASVPEPCEPPAALIQGLGKAPSETLTAFDYVAVYETEEEISALVPDHAVLRSLDLRGVVVTAPGRQVDFVSRFFAPRLGIDEDPVTGSAHCELAPFWGQRLGKTSLEARQLSRRGGSLACEWRGETVLLTGQVAHYMTAEITIPGPQEMPGFLARG